MNTCNRSSSNGVHTTGGDGVGVLAVGRDAMDIEQPHLHVHANSNSHRQHQQAASHHAPPQPPPCTPGGGVTDDLLRRSLDDFLRCCSSSCKDASTRTSTAANDDDEETITKMCSALSKATCNLTRLRDKCGTTVGPYVGACTSSSSGSGSGSSTCSSGMAVVLSPPTAETALRAIHAAFRLLVLPTKSADTAATTTTAEVLSFLSQAFSCLENDLIFTAMCLHVPTETEQGENNNGPVQDVNPFRILSAIILDDGNDSNNSDSNDNRSITEVQSLAIATLSRGMHAVEFVQRYATSVTSLPTACACSQDSALGVGLGLGLDRCRTIVEDVAVRLIDVVVALGEERISGSAGGVGATSNSTTAGEATTLPPNPYQRRQPGLAGAAAAARAVGATTTEADRPVKCDHLSLATKDTLRICSISLLSVLFRTDYADWALPSPFHHSRKQHQQKLERMCKILLSQAQRFGRDMHDRNATEVSAKSLSFLVLLNTKTDGTVLDERRIFDANTVDALLSSAFPVAGSRLPSRAIKDESLGRIVVQLLTDVAFGRGEGYAAFQQNHLSGALDRAWPTIVGCHREGILDQRVEGLENVLLSVLTLHGSSSSRSLVRVSLKSFLGVDEATAAAAAADGMLTDEDTPVTHNTQHRRPSDHSLQKSSCNDLVKSLLLLARHDCFGVSSLALGLLRSLLEHPTGNNFEDDLGRSLWMSVEKSKALADESSKFIQNSIALFQYVGSTKFDEGIDDGSMGIYADGKWRGNNPAFARFMPRLCITVDSMLVLMRSSSFTCRLTTFFGDDICDSPEDIASSFLLPSNSATLRSDLLRALLLSGATILAQVATSAQATPSESDINAAETLVATKKVLRRSITSQEGTITNAIGDSISEGSSCDLTVRVNHLVRVIGKVIPESEVSIAASIYASCRSVILDAMRSQKQASDTTVKLKQMEQRLESISFERDDLLHSIASIRASHAKELSRATVMVEANTVDERELLVKEKRRAEDQARQYRSRMIQAEDQCQKTSALEEEARTNLEQAKAAISQLSQRYEELEIQAKDEAERKMMAEEEVQELKQDVKEVERELNEKKEDLSELEKEHEAASDALQVVESSNSDLKQEMEDAYSRLVSLAQLFQVKEDDLAKANTTNRDELRRTRREVENLSSKCAVAEERADAIERENDELRRKVSRLKKELEKERSRKANGPVGYFNKLHDDFEEKESARRERSERSERRTGKENADRESSRSRSRASSRARDASDSQRRFYIAR